MGCGRRCECACMHIYPSFFLSSSTLNTEVSLNYGVAELGELELFTRPLRFIPEPYLRRSSAISNTPSLLENIIHIFQESTKQCIPI